MIPSGYPYANDDPHGNDNRGKARMHKWENLNNKGNTRIVTCANEKDLNGGMIIKI